MTQAVAKFAQEDTPEKVDVPQNWSGIIVWAVGRFGGGIVIAAVCAYMLHIVYADYRQQNMAVLEALTQQTEVNAKNVMVMEELRKTIQELTHEARSAHRWPAQEAPLRR
jgi:hypothetical protein